MNEAARLLGCHITDRPYQAGFLRAVRRIVHPDGGRCAECRPCPPPSDRLWWELLRTADRPPLQSLVRALSREPLQFGDWSAPIRLSYGVSEIGPVYGVDAVVGVLPSVV